MTREEILGHVARLDLARKRLERELAARVPSVDADFYYDALDRLTAAWALRLMAHQCDKCYTAPAIWVFLAEPGALSTVRRREGVSLRDLADSLVADLGPAKDMV